MAGETPKAPPPDDTDRAKLQADLAAAEAATADAHERAAQAQAAQVRAAAALAEIAGKRGGALKTTAKVEPAADEEKKDEAKQKWWLRYSVAGLVAFLLLVELAGLFVLLLLQGFGGVPYTHRPFKLNDWLFGVVISGVFVQTVWCLHGIATHLFPEGADKFKEMLAALKGYDGK